MNLPPWQEPATLATPRRNGKRTAGKLLAGKSSCYERNAIAPALAWPLQSQEASGFRSQEKANGRHKAAEKRKERSMTTSTEISSHPRTFGRYAEIPTQQLTPEQKEAYQYILRERGMCPGPYRIWLQNPRLLTAMTPIGVYFQNHMQLTKAEREIVTNCINGKWSTAGYSNAEHEEIGKQAGLPAEKVQALVAGLPTSFGDPRQQIIYEITQTLIAPRRLPEGLYKRGLELLGDAGLTDLTVLIGYFTSVSMTLAAYDVPAGAPDYRPYP